MSEKRTGVNDPPGRFKAHILLRSPGFKAEDDTAVELSSRKRCPVPGAYFS
jgi:hypothetical protein